MRALWAVLLVACSNELSYGRLQDEVVTPFACDTRGPQFAVGDGDPSCPGLHHALCSCGDYIASGPTRIQGALAAGGLFNAGDVIIDGPLTLAGDGAELTGDLRAQSLRDHGRLQGSHAVTIDGDARIAGDVRLQSLRVGGTFTLQEGAALEVNEGAPSAVRAPVAVTAPCDCTPSLDVGAQIELARTQNDNAAINLDSELGLRTFDSARTLELSCGRYFVSQIYAASNITLNVHGHVALYVDQRIVTESQASLVVTIDPGAQLDLFVRTGVTGAGPITIAGGAAHLYVGGGDSFFFSADTSIAAKLYAPNSELVTQQSFSLTGAALLKRVVAGALLAAQQTTSTCD